MEMNAIFKGVCVIIFFAFACRFTSRGDFITCKYLSCTNDTTGIAQITCHSVQQFQARCQILHSIAQNDGDVQMNTDDKACKRRLNYTIRNNIQEPTFEYSLAIRFCRQPFIRIMEKAVNRNRSFMFSATYFSKLGYFIDAINGVRGFYNVNKTWWAFLKAPDTMLPVGVSSYYPADGDHIIFNFTQS